MALFLLLHCFCTEMWRTADGSSFDVGLGLVVLMDLRINWRCKQKDMWEACFTSWIYVSSNEHKSFRRSKSWMQLRTSCKSNICGHAGFIRQSYLRKRKCLGPKEPMTLRRPRVYWKAQQRQAGQGQQRGSWTGNTAERTRSRTIPATPCWINRPDGGRRVRPGPLTAWIKWAIDLSIDAVGSLRRTQAQTTARWRKTMPQRGIPENHALCCNLKPLKKWCLNMIPLI